MIDGDESVSSPDVTATTGAADSTVRPLILDVRLSTDGGIQGRLGDADIYKIVFNKSMHVDTEVSGLFVMQDANGDTAEVDCTGVPGNCTLNTVLETVGSTEYAIGRVLTVELATLNLTINEVTPVEGVQYPVSLLTTNADVKDAALNVVNLADSTDKVVDVE